MTPTRIFSLFLLLPALLGCGPTLPETAPVTGKVTFRGTPVSEGTITFYPEKGRSATARLKPDGTYSLTTFEEGDGAIVGPCEVTIEAVRFANAGRATSFEEEIAQAKRRTAPPASGPHWLIPRQYSIRGQSELTAEVKPGENTIDFELP